MKPLRQKGLKGIADPLLDTWHYCSKKECWVRIHAAFCHYCRADDTPHLTLPKGQRPQP